MEPAWVNVLDAELRKRYIRDRDDRSIGLAPEYLRIKDLIAVAPCFFEPDIVFASWWQTSRTQRE